MATRRTTFAERSRSRCALAFVALAIVAGSATPSFAAPASRRASTAAPAPRVAAAQLTYHGGPVQHSSSVYAIFWVPQSYSLPADYQSTISQFFTDVAHDSYQASNIYGVTPQYYDTSGGKKRYGAYSVAFKGAVTDTRAFPASGCANYVLADESTTNVCLTNAQLQTELRFQIKAHSFPGGMGNEYFLFTPQGVASCYSSSALSTGGCYDPLQFNGFCAFHSHYGSGNQAVLYAHVPYDAIAGCTSGQSPNGNAADSAINNASHEQNETMSDPLGTAWFDASGKSLADKCHLSFGPPLGATAFGQWNQVINGHGYWLQQLWSNRARACVQRNTFPQPTVSMGFKPAVPVHGTKVKFSSSVREAGESSFTYHWSFPDGGVSSVAKPVHTFKSMIFVGTVSLIVSDKHGDQTRVASFITIK